MRNFLIGLTVATVIATVTGPSLAQSEQPDGRYRVVTGAISTPDARAPNAQPRAVVIMVDSWTGRTWHLNDQLRWRPLGFDVPDARTAGMMTVPPEK